MSDDWALSQGTVDFRNEERRAASGQGELFADPPKCPSCGTTRKNLCQWSADLSEGLVEPLSRRPRGCLDTAQLGPDEELPF